MEKINDSKQQETEKIYYGKNILRALEKGDIIELPDRKVSLSKRPLEKAVFIGTYEIDLSLIGYKEQQPAFILREENKVKLERYRFNEVSLIGKKIIINEEIRDYPEELISKLILYKSLLEEAGKEDITDLIVLKYKSRKEIYPEFNENYSKYSQMLRRHNL